MRNIALVLMYNGTAYHGWQVQKTETSVAQTLEKGLSIRKVAESADISPTEVKRIEDGVRKQPSPQVLRSLAAALNTPYEDLMEAAGYIDEDLEFLKSKRK